MPSEWKTPDDWQKDGTIISGVTSLKTGAWTSVLNAKETRNGKEIDVVIKTFCVPEDVLQDPERIAREREKFLASARLQKQLAESGAKAWVDILRLSEDPDNPSFSMKKCGPSLQDLIDRKIFLSAKDLYRITLSILQGFLELFEKHKRSHGSLKPSDVLTAAPGESCPWQLADPSPKGEDHSANDLFALGQILYELIEQKEWDPLTPIIPTKNWYRFGSRRDRWIQFLNMLLSPNGCHESLAHVKKEALRLKPKSALRKAALALGIFVVFAGTGIAAWIYLSPLILRRGGEQSAPPIARGPVVDEEAKAAWEKSRKAYTDVSERWQNRERHDRYDHANSRTLAAAARDLVPQQTLSTTADYRAAANAYAKAAAKLEEALTAVALEDKAGLANDDVALAEFQKAQADFKSAKDAWDAMAAKFNPQHDHAGSKAIADATQSPSPVPPPDAAGRRAAAEQFKAAAARFEQALALAKKEDVAILGIEQAKSNFTEARTKYQQARDKWDAAATGVAFDIAAAKTLAEEARAKVAEPVVLSDPASYQQSTEIFQGATAKLDQALALLDKLKREHNAAESDASTAIARANEALQNKDYPAALSWYKKAADLGSAPAMFNVGLLYESGRGVEKDDEQAARWYRQASDKNVPAAMVSLGLLHEKGRGVAKDVAQALALYKKAAEFNDPAAMRNIAYLYDNGIGVEKDQAEAFRWNKKAADLDDPSATYLVAVFYEQGKGVPPDLAQAIAWYEKAAALNYPRAMNDLGFLYETGRGTKADPVKALGWYKKAADLNFAPAMSNLGALYDNGIGVPRDPAEAFKWFQKGADLGHPMSMFNLAVLYETGRGTKADLGAALDWYRKAAKSEDEQAKQQALTRLESLGFSR